MALRFIESFDHATNGTVYLTKYATDSAFLAPSAGRTNNGILFTSGIHFLRTRNITLTGDIIIGAAINFGASLSATDLIRIYEDSTLHLQLTVDATGHLLVKRNTTTLATSTETVAINTWYYIEFKANIHDTTGSYEVRVDEVQWASITASGVDTRNGGTGVANNILFTGTTRTYDDLYVCDSSGSVNNDFLGACRVYYKLPSTGNGTNTGFSPSTGTDRGAMVDEANPDGDTSYNVGSSVDQVDTYNFADITASGTIRGVAVVPYAKKTDAGARKMEAVAYVGGTAYTATVSGYEPATSYEYQQRLFETNPNSGAPWTLTEINGAEFGVKVIS